MKVLMVNGSPHVKGNTTTALDEMRKIFEAEGVEVEYVQIGQQNVRGCIGCYFCNETGKCIFDDVVNKTAPIFAACDGLVVGAPVHYASANATTIAFLDRLFFSCHADATMKVGAAVVTARRGGCSATFDEINKYFTIAGMPVVSSQYWNMVYGMAEGEAEKDAEGLQTMRVLAKNMVFLMKSIALGKEKYGLPEKEEHVMTNFIR